MDEGAKAIVELVKDLEAALIIVRTNAAEKFDLTLQKAEIEIKLTSKKAAVGGFKFELIVPLNATTKNESATSHTLTLELIPKGSVGKAGAKETDAFAASIVELLHVHREVKKLNSTEFDVEGLKLCVQFERTTSGELQVVAGGNKSVTTAQQVKLTFWPS